MSLKPTTTPREPELDLLAPWQHKLHEIIFEADTRGGRLFDVVLFALIALSIVVVMAESVVPRDHLLRPWLMGIEVLLTFLFTIEYVLRILSVGHPWRYVLSFYGIIDVLAILPTYGMWIFSSGTPLTEPAGTLGSLTIVRAFRLLRVFRVLKLAPYLIEANLMLLSVRKTAAKITVFLLFVMIVCLILGTAMYVIEGQQPGSNFDNIPQGIYWAIVTVTTVGYGDIAPVTWLGQTVAAMAMIIGYSIIVVPTGIVTAEIISARSSSDVSTQACQRCSRDGHAIDAIFCKYCGMKL